MRLQVGFKGWGLSVGRLGGWGFTVYGLELRPQVFEMLYADGSFRK